jgi:hypothetical protein
METLNRALDNAQAWAESIAHLHEAHLFCNDDSIEAREISREARSLLRKGFDFDGCNRGEVLGAIEDHSRESVLCVEVRQDWHAPGLSADLLDFSILLSTGGPALRLRGDLTSYCEPRRAWLEYQDWYTPWREYHGGELDALLWFASLFWYGEG